MHISAVLLIVVSLESVFLMLEHGACSHAVLQQIIILLLYMCYGLYHIHCSQGSHSPVSPGNTDLAVSLILP